MSMPASIQLDAVRKVYEPGVVAVHGIDLTVREGELVVLVGPSGCGKSTTLRMVAGLETVTSGLLRIGDTVVNELGPADRDIAMVFQTYALYPHMTVRENMAFALKLRRRPATEITARVDAAASTLGLGELLDRTPRQLSGGQRQRVAIGRAIVREPSVFLFDEPLSNLDAALRGEMRRELLALHRRLGATMLYVTHDQVEAMTLGDRIVVMHEGRVRQVDTPANVYRRPRDTFVAGFLGSPPMNLLAARLTRVNSRPAVQLAQAPNAQLELSPAVAAAAQHASSPEVIVGVRPEDLAVSVMSSGAGIPTRLELAEPLGHEQLLHLRAGDAAITARAPADFRAEPGAVVHVRASGERLHLFAASTGISLAQDGM